MSKAQTDVVAALRIRVEELEKATKEERLRAIRAEAWLAQALDILEHANENCRWLTGGDERRIQTFLTAHGRKAKSRKP